MSTRSTATFNAPLTEYAMGIMQDQLAAYRLANLLCPIVQVSAASGTYKIYDDRNSFLAQPTERAIGGSRRRIIFDAQDGTYNCKPHGLEIGMDDFESALAGANLGAQAANQLHRGKIKALVNTKATAYAARVVDFATANLTAVSARGQWSSPDIDPIDELDEQLDALATVVGTTENIYVAMSTSVFRALRANSKVKTRLGIKDGISLSRDGLVNGLLFPVRLEVSAFSTAPNKFGQSSAGTKTQKLSGTVIIGYTSPNPTPMDASAFKCFSTSSVLVDAVHTYREESAASDIHAVDWSEHIAQTGSACAVKLSIT